MTGAVTVSGVIERVAARTGHTAAQLTGEGRSAPIAHARFAVCWVAHRALGASPSNIARALGGRNHSTAVHGLRRAERLRADDPAFRTLTDDAVAAIASAE